MFGVIYSSTFDFSVFSYPRPVCSSGTCYEIHATSIEERYCPKQHPGDIDDESWEVLLAREIQLFNESESDMLPCLPNDVSEENVADEIETIAYIQEDYDHMDVPPPTPMSAVSTYSTPSLVRDNDTEDSLSVSCNDSDGNDTDYEAYSREKDMLSAPASLPSKASGKKRKRGKVSKSSVVRKRLCRAPSSTSIATISSMASTSSSTALLQSMLDSENPWKCPHCPWVQTTKRLPDFLRHQRSHFVSQSDWPCPNPKCGKGFARKDSLKRHLDNRSTGCTRPPGYTVC